MRLVDLDIPALAEAFGRRGYGMNHLEGNTLVLLDGTKIVAKFTSHQVGEHARTGVETPQVVDALLKELGLKPVRRAKEETPA